MPAYTMAPHANQLKLMRVVIREDFSRSRCDSLIADLALAVKELKDIKSKNLIDPYMDHMDKHYGQRTGKQTNDHFSDEQHSLKGKHGKTHAVC